MTLAWLSLTSSLLPSLDSPIAGGEAIGMGILVFPPAILLTYLVARHRVPQAIRKRLPYWGRQSTHAAPKVVDPLGLELESSTPSGSPNPSAGPTPAPSSPPSPTHAASNRLPSPITGEMSRHHMIELSGFTQPTALRSLPDDATTPTSTTKATETTTSDAASVTAAGQTGTRTRLTAHSTSDE
jgi:hypothetical protein